MKTEFLEETIHTGQQSVEYKTQKDTPVIVGLDNGIITKLRIGQKGIKYEWVNIVSFVLKRYNVQYVLMTDKLFIEVIGQGDFRDEIQNKDKEQINAQKERFKDKVILGSFTKKDIEELHSFYVDFFDRAIRAYFPRLSICEMVNKNLEEYPFHEAFHGIHHQVVEYAKAISDDLETYEKFISGLVRDSVIRYMLDITNFNEISSKPFANADALLNEINDFLIVKYALKGLLSNDLILLISRLVYVEEVKGTRTEKVNKDGNKKIKELIRPEDDSFDSEMAALTLYGDNMNGIRQPVTIFTCEPIETVEKRIHYTLEIIKRIPSLKLRYKNNLVVDPTRILIGRTIHIDIKSLNCTEISLEPDDIYGVIMKKQICHN